MTKKGYKLTEEHKKNISEAHKGKLPKNFELFKKKSKEYRLNNPNKPGGMLGKHHSEETKNIIRNKKLGIKHTEEWKKIMSLRNSGKNNPFYEKKHTSEAIEKNRTAHLGENNSNWRGGQSPYGRDFNKFFKEAIKLRDYACIICGSNSQLSVHHIDYNRLHNAKENCVALCRSCHCKTNFNRESWYLFFNSLLNKRYGYEIENRIEELKRILKKQSISLV